MTWFIIENACHVVVVETTWTITLKTCTLLIYLTKLLTRFKKKNLLNLQLIEQVYQNDQFDLWELFSEICWFIWYPRNKIRVNDVQGLLQLMMYNADSVNNSSVSKKLRPWARKDYLTGYFLQIVKFFFIRNLWISLPILLVVEFPNLLAC